MISLYFHIPFCYKKCNYCSFYIVPTSNLTNSVQLKQRYLENLKNQIDYQLSHFYSSKNVYTIYFWWWTPSEFWLKNIFDLMDYVANKFDLSNLEEFSFEINPLLDGSIKKTLDFVKNLYEKFWNATRISIGIQSLNNQLLQLANRDYDLKIIYELLENFPPVKVNLDFISFWLEDFFDKSYFEKFYHFVLKYKDLVDSYSIYTLELHPGSIFANSSELAAKVGFNNSIEDKILANFKKYKEIVEKYYPRYEISNFAKKGYESKHNLVYWLGKEYLGFGTSASGFVNKIRYTNSFGINDFIKWKFDFYEYKKLTQKELLEEKVFLWLRLTKGIKLTKEIEKVINMDKLNQLLKEWYFCLKEGRLALIEKGFDVYNYLMTEILF